MNGGRILVAGATGRVGSAAVRLFLEVGFGVRALVRRAEKGELLRALGAEIAVGDVKRPGTLAAAVEGCDGVFSALAAGSGPGDAATVEYGGNMNLLSAAREAGIRRFVYNSALMADHPLAQRVETFREKARFERELGATEDISSTILQPAMFMETLLLALRGPVAFIFGSQSRPAAWIPAADVARAAVRAFEHDIIGLHQLAGSDFATFDEAYRRLSQVHNRKIMVVHLPLPAGRFIGRAISPVGEIAGMFTLFDEVGYAADPTALRETFGVEALTIEEWAARVS